MLLIDCAWWKLCNIWLFLAEDNSSSITTYWRNIVAVIARDRMIDDNLKSQFKNWTLNTCRLFLQTRIFQYISNRSKADVFLLHICSKLFKRNNFSVHYPGFYVKPWISRKNCKPIKLMIKTQILLWKTLSIRFRVRGLFYFILNSLHWPMK